MTQLDQSFKSAKQLPDPMNMDEVKALINNAPIGKGGKKQLVTLKNGFIMIGIITAVSLVALIANGDGKQSKQFTTTVIEYVDTVESNLEHLVLMEHPETVFVEITDLQVIVKNNLESVFQFEAETKKRVMEMKSLDEVIKKPIIRPVGKRVRIDESKEFSITAGTKDSELKRIEELAKKQGVKLNFSKLKRKKDKITHIQVKMKFYDDTPTKGCNCGSFAINTSRKIGFAGITFGWKVEDGKIKNFYSKDESGVFNCPHDRSSNPVIN
jgi:hypothetical protein